MSGKTGFDLAGYLGARREQVDAALEKRLPPEDLRPESLHRAMRYSVFSGGKRLRPVLCLASCEACGGDAGAALPAACAIELVHTYSLIHDDLPCMDDDDLRRGKPTSHKVFGEAVALLAGDALLTLAFELLAVDGARAVPAAQALRVAAEIAAAAGSDGMVAGQVTDIESENKKVNGAVVDYIHGRKTGRLIACAVRCGAIAAGAGEDALAALTVYGSKLGLAFQIADDIMDAEGGFGDLKSGRGLDRARGKATYPGVFGLGRARAAALDLIAGAKAALPQGEGEFAALAALADSVAARGRGA